MQTTRRQWLGVLAGIFGFPLFDLFDDTTTQTQPRVDRVVSDPTTLNNIDADATELDVSELDGPQVDLKKQLETGLLARRESEFQYIDRVVLLVQNDQLSEELVKSTFQWARTKRPYPFPYFRKALKIRAAREGVTIP